MHNEHSKTLIGWKEIAAYLNCSPSSARRREEEGLPVFRVGGSVRAYAAEIDRWIRKEHNAHPASPSPAQFDGAIPEGLDLKEVISAFTVERGGRRFAVVPLGISAAELEHVVARLKSSEEKYRDLLEKVPAWIWETDARGRYQYSNGAVAELLGYEPENILGLTPEELGIVPEDAALFERSFEALRREGKAIKYLECSFVHRDGTLRRLETHAEAAFDGGGGFAGIRGVSYDITGRRPPPGTPP
jgi:PAS domain S-box-containing protein